MNIYTLSINGTHTSILKTFYETVKTSNNKGYYNIQVFLGSPYNLTRKSFSDEDIKQTKQYLDRQHLTVFTHLPYVINLAGSVKLNNYCWNGDKMIDNYIEDKFLPDLILEIITKNRVYENLDLYSVENRLLYSLRASILENVIRNEVRDTMRKAQSQIVNEYLNKRHL
jgi:hypothetical protein